ncbi:MAG: hypothetical protein AB1349_08940 [Elusimicrobiota bacterium]
MKNLSDFFALLIFIGISAFTLFIIIQNNELKKILLRDKKEPQTNAEFDLYKQKSKPNPMLTHVAVTTKVAHSGMGQGKQFKDTDIAKLFSEKESLLNEKDKQLQEKETVLKNKEKELFRKEEELKKYEQKLKETY